MKNLSGYNFFNCSKRPVIVVVVVAGEASEARATAGAMVTNTESTLSSTAQVSACTVSLL